MNPEIQIIMLADDGSLLYSFMYGVCCVTWVSECSGFCVHGDPSSVFVLGTHVDYL